MNEYAFDVVLNAIVRVTAESEQDAREKISYQIDAIDLNYRSDDIRITEASIVDDADHGVVLFEINGVET